MSKAKPKHPTEDDVLRRMLNTPPKPHKGKPEPKPAPRKPQHSR